MLTNQNTWRARTLRRSIVKNYASALENRWVDGNGIPQYEAQRYEGRVKEGEILLSVHSDIQTDT